MEDGGYASRLSRVCVAARVIIPKNFFGWKGWHGNEYSVLYCYMPIEAIMQLGQEWKGINTPPGQFIERCLDNLFK